MMIAHRPKRHRKAGSHAPQFDLGRELHRISGVDLTRIDGIDVGVAQTVISEVGLDMSRWEDEDHFASWLGLCPDNRITGGKVMRKGTPRRPAAIVKREERNWLGRGCSGGCCGGSDV